MTTPTPITVSPVFEKYAAALLPFFIIVVGAAETVLKDPTNVQNDVIFGLLVLGNVLTLVVPLVPSIKWQGILKTGIPIITTILAAVLPFLLPSGFEPKVSGTTIAVGVLNALATEFGVYIRTSGLSSVVSTVTAALASGSGTFAAPATSAPVAPAVPAPAPTLAEQVTAAAVPAPAAALPVIQPVPAAGATTVINIHPPQPAVAAPIPVTVTAPTIADPAATAAQIATQITPVSPV